MSGYWLRIRLESEATFGRGDGVAGLVDVEVQHDEHGLPYLGGRALKGILGAECAEIIFALEHAVGEKANRWRLVERRLFGDTGSMLEGEALLMVGPARLPDDLRASIAHQIWAYSQRRPTSPGETLTRAGVIETLTALRRQTAMDAHGAPKKETLRTVRVIIRGLEFDAPLNFVDVPSDDDLALLAAGVKALRRLGSLRNRGVGRIKAELLDNNRQPISDQYFDHFRKAVTS